MVRVTTSKKDGICSRRGVISLVVLSSLVLLFGGCVRSSTLKKALAEADAARTRAETTERANRAHLEEIASLKKEVKDLRARNEGLVEKDMKESELIASQGKSLKKKTTENEALWKEVAALRAASHGRPAHTPSTDEPAGTYAEIYMALREDVDAGSVSVKRGRGVMSILINEKALFEPGSAALLPEGKALLQRISSAQGVRNGWKRRIKVRATAACKGERNGKGAAALGARRAAVVTRFLNERGNIKGPGQRLPYEEAPAKAVDGYVEIVFPAKK